MKTTMTNGHHSSWQLNILAQWLVVFFPLPCHKKVSRDSWRDTVFPPPMPWTPIHFIISIPHTPQPSIFCFVRVCVWGLSLLWLVTSLVYCGTRKIWQTGCFKDDNKRTWFNVVNSHPLSHNPQDPMTLTPQAWLRLSGPCQTRHRLPTDCLLQFFIVVSKVCSSCSFCCSYHDIV